MPALHVTNGDSAAARLRPLLGGEKLICWRDMLHDGPVPAGLSLAELSAVRAVFIAGRGCTDDVASVLNVLRERDAALLEHDRHAPLTVWLEHDLYDQLQLAQILALAAELELRNVRLVQADDYLGTMPAAALAALRPRPVGSEQLQLATHAWAAFRAFEPTKLAALAAERPAALPHLGVALVRLLEELPAPRNGLSRLERATLAHLAEHGPADRAALFHAVVGAEEPRWLGDLPYFHRLDGLGVAGLIDDTIAVTDLGRRCLTGEVDRVTLPGFARWQGGVRLAPGSVWRYDAVGGAVSADAV